MKKYSQNIFIVLTVFICLLPGCSESTVTDSTNDIPEISNDSTNYFTPLHSWVSERLIVGGEFLIIQGRDTLVHEVAGWKDRDENILWDKNTICRIRSMTKPIVGTAILMLYEQGKLDLDDRASRYLSAFDNDRCREITIRQLLHHTAGFSDPGFPGWAANYNSLDEIITALAENGPVNTPGSVFQYSDGGSSALAAIVTAASRKPAEQFIRENIFEPLNMHDSYCLLTNDAPDRSRISDTYQGGSRNWRKYWDNYSTPEVSFFRGSGGIFTTVSDYARFLAMWLNKGNWNSVYILDSSTVNLALTPSAQSLQSNFPYGMQWQIYDDPIFSHTGSDGTLASADPDRNLLVLYFTQSRGHNTFSEVTNVINTVLNNH